MKSKKYEINFSERELAYLAQLTGSMINSQLKQPVPCSKFGTQDAVDVYYKFSDWVHYLTEEKRRVA